MAGQLALEYALTQEIALRKSLHGEDGTKKKAVASRRWECEAARRTRWRTMQKGLINTHAATTGHAIDFYGVRKPT